MLWSICEEHVATTRREYTQQQDTVPYDYVTDRNHNAKLQAGNWDAGSVSRKMW